MEGQGRPHFLWIYQSHDLFFFVIWIHGFRLCATRDWGLRGQWQKRRIPFPSTNSPYFSRISLSSSRRVSLVPLCPRRESASAADLNHLPFQLYVSDYSVCSAFLAERAGEMAL